MDLTTLTDDEFERELLAHPEPRDLDPDDPMMEEIAHLSTHISNIAHTLPRLHREIAPYLRQDLTNKKIAEKVGCTPQTVAKASKNPAVQRLLNLMERVNRIHTGSSLQQRAYMLWTIAKRNHKSNPNTSIRAIEALNKQEGVYTDDKQNQGVVVNIQKFVVNEHENAPPTAPIPHDPTPLDEVEGAFSPLTITAPTPTPTEDPQHDD